jgi:hypothetical protein
MEARQRIQTKARCDDEEVSELPSTLTEKASLAGKEYGWRIADFPTVLTKAGDLGLLCLGGQFQFRLSNGTCEMYWLEANSSERKNGEPWPDYVLRAKDEVLMKFEQLVSNTDFVGEGRENFDLVRKQTAEGADLLDKLFFVAYFVDEREWGQLPHAR